MTVTPSRLRARPALWLVAGAAAVAVLATVAIPAVIAARLEGALRPSLPAARIDVRLQGAPWRMLAGSFSVLQIQARGAEINQLRVDRLFLRIGDAHVPLGPLFRGGTVSVRTRAGGEGQIALSRESVQEYLSRSKGVQRPTVTMEQGLVTIEGDVKVGEMDLRARIVGRLVIASPRTVNLHVQELTVSGVEIPREVGALLVASFNPLINLEGLPIPARVSSVAIEGGEVTMIVRVDPQ